MNPRNFFAELKRRNVYKVAVAYAVVAWLLIQAASILFPTFEAPAWVMKVSVTAILFGFPIALVLAWAFEITPEGIKRESEIEPNKSIARRTGRKIVALTIALAVVAAGLFVYQFVRSKSNTPQLSEAAPAAPSKSIAVLPFDNLSRDPDNAYFAEGVQDEILTRLAKVADLKVISRTSTQKYKSAPDNLRAIARQLGVANILEGSVQKANDRVRVNVQLINASNDAHLWADIYDRQITDIFAAESEIAKSIAATLQAKLTGSERTAMAKVPTENAEAYELYLKGNYFWNKRTGADLRKAIDYFNQAIAKDPGYALAYVGLADAYLLLANYGAAAPRDSLPQAKAAVMKAIELDNNLAEAHASLGLLSMYDCEFERAVSEFDRAIELSPNYAMAHHWFGDGPLMALARTDRSVAEGMRAVELDPLSLINNADFGWVLFNARRYDEAIAQLRKTLEIDPRFYLARYYLGEPLQMKGQLPAAIAEYRAAAELNDDPLPLALLGQAYARAGQRDEAQKVLVRLTAEAKSRYVSQYSFALVLLGLGDKEGAMDALERAYANREFADIGIIRVDPFLDDLRGTPRFEALAEKILPARVFAKTAAPAK
jgi:serine/threonine-protein kinase